MKNMQYNSHLISESQKFLQDQFGQCELGYGADTTFHTTNF